MRHPRPPAALVALGAMLLGAIVTPAGVAPVVAGDRSVIERPPPGWVDDPRRPIVEEPRGVAPVATTERTDVVVIMLDDVALHAAPRLLDRLPSLRQLFVRDGTRFSHAYGDTPLCCPGRASFLTGLNTVHHGVTRNQATLFDPRPSVATALRRSAYYTFIVGKYLNGTGSLDDKTPPGWVHSLITGGGYYFYRAWRDGVVEYHDGDANDYSTDVYANAAVGFLRAAPQDRPLFALVTPAATHTGYDEGKTLLRFPVAAPRHRGDPRCADIGSLATPAWNEEDVSDKPTFIADLSPISGPGFEDGWPLRPACEALLSVDELVSRMRRELRAQGRLARTVFVLTADNGMDWGNHRHRHKSLPYSTPIPLYVRWPPALHDAPAVIDEGVSMIDLAPTICDLAGCTLGPYGTDDRGADGLSLVPLLEGGTGRLGRDALLESHPAFASVGWYAVRTTERHDLGPWHYVEYGDGQRELYDLAADPWELENRHGTPALADVEAALADELDRLLGR